MFPSREVNESKGFVDAVTTVEGTNSADYVKNDGFPEAPSFAKTGKAFKLPPERIACKVESSKITLLTLEGVSGGGFRGIFEQLNILTPIDENEEFAPTEDDE